MRSGRWANHSPASGAEAKYASISPIYFNGVIHTFCIFLVILSSKHIAVHCFAFKIKSDANNIGFVVYYYCIMQLNIYPVWGSGLTLTTTTLHSNFVFRDAWF